MAGGADLNFRIGADTSAISGAIGQLKGLVASFVGVAAAAKAISAADELTSLNARLKLVTDSTDDLARAQTQLFALAQRSRTSLGETVKLYTQIGNAVKDAGVGQNVLLGVVETINQAVQLSGSSAQAAEAALVQLGQGLASGTLRGEELNSILEQTPALADAIAKGLNITRGQLRQYGQDGKLSAEAVIGALQKQSGAVAAAFNSLPVTVGQALTQVSNASLKLLGSFDGASGATSSLAGLLQDLASFLASDALQGAVVALAETWAESFRTIASDTREAIAIIEDATAGLFPQGENLISFLGRAFTELPRNIRTVVRIATAVIAAFVERVIAESTFARDAIAAIFTDDTIDEAIDRRNRRIAAGVEALKEFVDEEVNANRAAAEALKERQRSEAAARASRIDSGDTARLDAKGKFTRNASEEQKKSAQALAKARLDGEEKSLEDSSKRQLTILQSLYGEARLSLEQYLASRQSIELAALNASIEIEKRRAAGAANPAERQKSIDAVRLLERQKFDIEEKARVDKLAAERDLQSQLAQLRAQELEGQGRTAEAAALRIEEQFRDLRKRLAAEGNADGLALVDRLIDTGKAKANFDEIKAQFDRTLIELRSRQQQLADQVATGALAPETGNAEQSAARQQAAAELTVLNEKLQELALRSNDPAIKQGARDSAEAVRQLAIDGATGVEAALIQLRSSLAQMQQQFAQNAAGAGVDALTGLFTDLASGTKSAGEALKDFVRGFVSSMAQIAARALATFLVLQLLDAIYPGLGKAVGAGAAASANVKHGGGMVGSGQRRSVDPMLFFGAPRYHSGGMVGLAPDERPAILQTGEEVLSRTDSRNQANGGGGYRIVNVVDPSLAGDYLESAAGEKAVLNVIRRNPGTVKQIVG